MSKRVWYPSRIRIATVDGYRRVPGRRVKGWPLAVSMSVWGPPPYSFGDWTITHVRSGRRLGVYCYAHLRTAQRITKELVQLGDWKRSADAIAADKDLCKRVREYLHSERFESARRERASV